jgi:hypothetical protein
MDVGLPEEVVVHPAVLDVLLVEGLLGDVVDNGRGSQGVQGDLPRACDKKKYVLRRRNTY